MYLETLAESDYEDQQMNFGIVATTNVSHNSDDVRDAEEQFKNMMAKAGSDEDKMSARSKGEPKKDARGDSPEKFMTPSNSAATQGQASEKKSSGAKVFNFEDNKEDEPLTI